MCSDLRIDLADWPGRQAGLRQLLPTRGDCGQVRRQPTSRTFGVAIAALRVTGARLVFPVSQREPQLSRLLDDGASSASENLTLHKGDIRSLISVQNRPRDLSKPATASFARSRVLGAPRERAPNGHQFIPPETGNAASAQPASRAGSGAKSERRKTRDRISRDLETALGTAPGADTAVRVGRGGMLRVRISRTVPGTRSKSPSETTVR